jgi:hypothetical protein
LEAWRLGGWEAGRLGSWEAGKLRSREVIKETKFLSSIPAFKLPSLIAL